MSLISRRSSLGLFAIAAFVAMFVFVVPHADAKRAKLGGQLVGDAQAKGSKVTAPILLSQSTAKKLKLDSALATLKTKRSTQLSAPNPTGTGTVKIGADTLRSGDELAGKAKVKGNREAVIPKVAGSKLSVKDRESAFSVDELTAALVALYSQVNALTVRVNDLEDALQSQIDALRAELEALKAENASLAGQINSILTQLTSLESALGTLETTVTGLVGDLADVDTALTGLQNQLTTLAGELDALEAIVGPLGVDVDTLQTQVGTLQGQVTGLLADVSLLCTAFPLVC